MFLRRDVDNSLKMKEKQLQFERELTKLNHEECKKLIDQNAKREVEREHRYKQFFSDYDKHMKERLNWHTNYVNNAEDAKSKKLQDWIQKNENVYTQRQKELDLQMRQWRKAVNKECSL